MFCFSVGFSIVNKSQSKSWTFRPGKWAEFYLRARSQISVLGLTAQARIGRVASPVGGSSAAESYNKVYSIWIGTIYEYQCLSNLLYPMPHLLVWIEIIFIVHHTRHALPFWCIASGVTGKFSWGGGKVTFPNFFPALSHFSRFFPAVILAFSRWKFPFW